MGDHDGTDRRRLERAAESIRSWPEATVRVVAPGDTVVTVAVGGELDHVAMPEVRRQLLAVLPRGCRELRMDLSDASYAGAAFLHLVEELSERGVRVVPKHASGSVALLLRSRAAAFLCSSSDGDR